MQKYITKNGRKLKKGYTTGICAAAASKACALMLLTGKDIDKIHMKWSFGRGKKAEMEFRLEDVTRGDDFVRCAVRKDAGDDPDATDGMLIYAEVRKEPFGGRAAACAGVSDSAPGSETEIKGRTGSRIEAGRASESIAESAAVSAENHSHSLSAEDAELTDVGADQQSESDGSAGGRNSVTLDIMAGPDGVIPLRWDKAADYIKAAKIGRAGMAGAAVSDTDMSRSGADDSGRATGRSADMQRASEYEAGQADWSADGISERKDHADRDEPRFVITGGEGVGVVTMPGLDQPVGAAAINSGPRRMITQSLEDACETAGYEGRLFSEISVPGGVETAKKTFNPVLGIKGGISILGTTGIVEPMSGRAVEETVRAEVRVKAERSDFLAFVPGNSGMAFVENEMMISDDKIVTMSNYPGAALDEAADCGVAGVLIAGSLGKLVKLAGGIFNTHSHEADARMDILIRTALRAGADLSILREIDGCVTTDSACDVLEKRGLLAQTMKIVTERAQANVRRRVPEMRTELIILKNTGEVLGFTDGAFDIAEA